MAQGIDIYVLSRNFLRNSTWAKKKKITTCVLDDGLTLVTPFYQNDKTTQFYESKVILSIFLVHDTECILLLRHEYNLGCDKSGDGINDKLVPDDRKLISRRNRHEHYLRTMINQNNESTNTFPAHVEILLVSKPGICSTFR